MIGRVSAIVLTVALTVAPAAAEEVPQRGDYDARVRVAAYNDQQVYRLNVALRSAMQVVFSAGEKIENIAVGDSVAWEVAPSGHILFIKPLERSAPTNLIATTVDGRGMVRNYHFELNSEAQSVDQRSGAVFALRFVYPEVERARFEAEEAERLKVQALAVEAQAITLALDAALAQGPRNLAYSLAGPAEIAPSEVSDNGVSTVLRFPRGQAVPAIYKVLPDGSEALVNFDVRGEFVVIHEVAAQLRLRLGRSMVCIWNDRPSPQVGDLSTGTISRDVERQVEN